MSYLPSETPPVERKPPMSEAAKVGLWIFLGAVSLVILALTVENAGPGRMMMGLILVVFLVWFVMVLVRGKDPDRAYRNRTMDERPPEV